MIMMKKKKEIEFDWDDDLLLNNVIEIYNVTLVFRAIFYENNKYYSQLLFR